MKNNEFLEIKELLEKIKRIDLISELMTRRSIGEVKNILSMSEWE